MFRGLASLILALILALAAYAAFWWSSLSYNSAVMRGSVETALNGALTYGKPQWIPVLTNVHVRWPAPRLLLREGPIREVKAPYLIMVSQFFARDRWKLVLPQEMKLLMASGTRIIVQTVDGELVWLSDPARLAFRAKEVTILSEDRRMLGHVADVMVERRPTDDGVRINLASRPDMAGGTTLLSGQLVIPSSVAEALLQTMASNGVPELGSLMRVMAEQLRLSGAAATLDNISFRQGDMSGAVFGTLRVGSNGDLGGEMVVTADSVERLLGWVDKAKVIEARSVPEKLGYRALLLRMTKHQPMLRIEVIPDGLLLNGETVGPIPKVADVMARLWPQR